MEKSPKDTRQQLLQATKELVSQKGCAKMTLRDLMEVTGLSKGAIYHYVSSKDELLALVLREAVVEVDTRFQLEISKDNAGFSAPFAQIMKNAGALEDLSDVRNQIFIYLLSKQTQPIVAEVMRLYHEQSVKMAQSWIEAGQHHGVIAPSIDAEKAAELFNLITYGLRLRSFIPEVKTSFTVDDFIIFISQYLRSDDTQGSELE
ncbi:TetR/AcrR family transcriptional regulator [Mechercharimyces sp. CAU 1602]|uniref:TetR/AcrR family transcriptional regulator n=1 Tax=Mechercharimyces sp. CAU 1602 TaxID=2973933 RepID=UPI002163E465|nr:TetR/AcrR family transcriptional regulator [Mechercharimyces sp. CAU 1602]MCS1352587.1 TetR/AcrR family transcriptional regulator [Mechercharimyces sp. CAU 1602]